MKRSNDVIVESEVPLLPLELWQLIFSNLGQYGVFQCNRVCRAFDNGLLCGSIKTINLLYHKSNTQFCANVHNMVNVETISDYHDGPTLLSLQSFRRLIHLKVLCKELSCFLKLDDLIGLRTLSLCGASMYRVSPSSLGRLTNLERLECQDIRGIDDNDFLELRKLTHLRIPDYSGFTSSGLSSLTTLQSLYMTGSVLSEQTEWIFPDSLEQMTLTAVNTSASLSRLTKLVSLCIVHPPYDNFNYNKLVSLTKLETLVMISNQTHNITNEVLRQMTNLRGLTLKVWSIGQTHEHPLSSKALKGLTNLTSLSLGYSIAFSMKHLISLPNLKFLEIRNRRIQLDDLRINSL